MATINDLVLKRTLRKLYLTEISSSGPSFSSDLGDNIGLKPFPQGGPRDAYRVYRVLGTNKDDLSCNSMRLVLTNRPTVDEGVMCGGFPVLSVEFDLSDQVPFVDLGHSKILMDDLIDDPFDDYAPAGYRAQLGVRNDAFLDLHVIWKQDTHQAPQEDFVRHNETLERKSKNIDYDAKAKFVLEFYQNNAGSRGRYIGDATVKVRGRKDISLIVSNLDGGRKELQYIDWLGVIVAIGSVLL